MIKFFSRKFDAFWLKTLYLINNFSSKQINKPWLNFPFGNLPKASRENYIELWENEKNSEYPSIDKFERDLGFALSKSWLDNLALHTQIVVKDYPLCYAHGRILYSTLAKYIVDNKEISKRPLNIIETGTARGFSSICMAKALNDYKSNGRILTFDVLPHEVSMFWNCIDDLEGPKTRSQLLEPWSDLMQYILFIQGDTRKTLSGIKCKRVNLAFFDGAHTYEDVIHEFSQIKSRQSSGDIIIFDDYSPGFFDGVVQAVDAISSRYSYNKELLDSGSQRGYAVLTKI